MKHTVLVTGHPDKSVASERALSCCGSIISRGDQINQVFFMHDANYVAVHQNATQWSAFAAANNISLQTCVSTAEQKSIQSRYYAAGFLQGGLSSLADSILSSSVVHQFNDDTENAHLADIDKPSVESKTINFVFEVAPFEGSLAAEGVDLLLVLCAFEANLNVIFVGDGLKNIIEINDKSPRYIKRFKALADFGIENVYTLKTNNFESREFTVNSEELSLQAYQDMLESGHVLNF